MRDEQRQTDIRNIPIGSVGVTGRPSCPFDRKDRNKKTNDTVAAEQKSLSRPELYGRINMDRSKERLTCCNGHFALHDIEGILALGILASLSGNKRKTGDSSRREATGR